MDTDGNGTLSRDEVLFGFEEHFGVGITSGQVDQMFLAVDVDNSGEIDYTEFVMATMNEKELITNEKLKAAFKIFDTNGNGTIGPSEINKVLNNSAAFSEERIEQLISEVDVNNDGEISFDEFCVMMKQLTNN
jgi:calcium-dependent protein kinase